MKLGKWARLFLAAAPLLSGCKGFWDVPSGSGGSGGGGTTSGVFYVLNQKTAQIAGYTIASGSTSLTAVPNSPYPWARRSRIRWPFLPMAVSFTWGRWSVSLFTAWDRTAL